MFQLVPLRWPLSTAVAGSMIGEIGALAGGLVPTMMGMSKQYGGTYRWGFIGIAMLAIVALVVGMRWGVTWMDPLMGIVGAVLVTVWAWGLLRSTGRVLLDAEMDAPVVEEIREVIAALPYAARIADLHVWRIGTDRHACLISLVTEATVAAEAIRAALQIHEELVHITVEVQRPEGASAAV